MSPEFSNGTCPFCGADAQATVIDGGNRDVFLCSNSECGDSEVTTIAMARIKDSSDLCAKYQEKANSCKAKNRVLEVTVTNSNLQSVCIERR